MFSRAPEIVLQWYLYRRSICRGAEPNAAHLALVKLEEALEGIEGVRTTLTMAQEGVGMAIIECKDSADITEVVDIAVDGGVSRIVLIHGSPLGDAVVTSLRHGYGGKGYDGLVVRPDELATVEL